MLRVTGAYVFVHRTPIQAFQIPQNPSQCLHGQLSTNLRVPEPFPSSWSS